MTPNELNDVYPIRDGYFADEVVFTNTDRFAPLPGHGQSSPQELVAAMKPNGSILRGVVSLGEGRCRVFGFGLPSSADKKSPIVISEELRATLDALTDEQYKEQAEGFLWTCKADRAYAFSSFYLDYAFDYAPTDRGEYRAVEVDSAAEFITKLLADVDNGQAKTSLWHAVQYLGSR